MPRKRLMVFTMSPFFYLVRLEGFEPPTHCLEGSCSIQLSYKRAFRVVVEDGRGVKKNFMSAFEPVFYTHTEATAEEAYEQPCETGGKDGSFPQAFNSSQEKTAQKCRQ